MRRISGVFAVAIAFAAGACAPVGPDFVKPDLDPPADWSQSVEQGLDPAAHSLDRWWEQFNDPVLNELVERARRNNNALQISGLGVLEARALLGIASGSSYPQTQILAGSAMYVSPAENTGVKSGFGQYSVGLSATWEIDFWGKYRRGIESADAAFMASKAGYSQAQVLLTAAVVSAYSVARITEAQLEISEQNVVLQERSFQIASVLFENGEDSELDVQQAKTLLLATQASIPSLRAALKQAYNALSVLVGEPPGTIDAVIGAGPIPEIPEAMGIGFPADMLRRRPDVFQAELLAMAQNAQVGLAEASLYPSFSLLGSIGMSAGGPGDSDFGQMFDADALGFSVGPQLIWPFFNYGRIKNNVRVQDARLQQALVAYRETVLQAAREAEDAMAGYVGARQQAEILAKAVESAKRSNQLSTLRYREGFSDYQRVLDSQQALFSQQQRYIAARGEAVLNLIGLFQALGGGWEADTVPRVRQDTLEAMQQRTDWGQLINVIEPVDGDRTYPRPDW